MRSKWTELAPLEHDVEYLALASSIPPKSMRSTFALFKGAGEVRKQLTTTDGVVGFSLLAEPLRKRYATLSVWRHEAALEEFARSQPHGRLMQDLRPAMGPTKFVTWTFRGGAGLPTWDDALGRLG